MADWGPTHTHSGRYTAPAHLHLLHLHRSEVGVPEQQGDRRVPGPAPADWAWCRGGGVCHHPGEIPTVLAIGAVTVLTFWCR